MSTGMRQGLPRVAGGAPWPPADARVPHLQQSAAVREDTVALPPTVAAAPQGPVGLRRGLPRTAGGEPWPPADLVTAFDVSAITAARPAVAAPEALVAEPPRPAEAPHSAEATAWASGGDAGGGPAPATPSRASEMAGARGSGGAGSTTRAASRLRSVIRLDRVTNVVVGATLAVVIAAAVVLLVRILIFQTPLGVAFLARFPGEVSLPAWAPVGFPAWLMWQHWLNAFFLVLIVKTGWTIRRTTRPTATWQPRRGGQKIAVELWIHLSLDILWLANGAIFVVLLFATGQWIRVVPFTAEFVPNAISAALQYVSLSWPTEDGWTNYNALQVLAYFVTIFIAAPLAALSGVRMSPLWPSKARRLSAIYPVELARRIHFPVMLYFVFFIVVHVFLVLATGALRNLNHMFWGSPEGSSWAGAAMFGLGTAVIVAAAVALRPVVVAQLASIFGKVGR